MVELVPRVDRVEKQERGRKQKRSRIVSKRYRCTMYIQ